MADKAVVAVEKVVHHEDMDPVTLDEKNVAATQAETVEDVTVDRTKV